MAELHRVTGGPPAAFPRKPFREVLMSQNHDFDVAVVGAGPAGYVAGIRAAQLGAKVCLIEKGPLGGCCTNVGCIPTKVLWRTAELMLEARHLDESGIEVPDVQLNWSAVSARREAVTDKLRKGIGSLLGANDVELVRAAAAFDDPHTLRLEGEEGERRLTASRLMVATGSRAVELPVAPFDHEVVIDSSDAVTADELPESVIIVGGGYIGVEFASIYAICGVEVTIVEMLDRLLPAMDEDCAREATRMLKKNGVSVRTGTKLEEVSRDDGGVRATLSDGEEASARQMLVCVGRRPDCRGLAVEKAGLEPAASGAFEVNEHMQTAVPHIYAIGDVAGGPLLAHVGSQEGLVAAAHATGSVTAAMDYRLVPACVFVHPEIATVGLSVEEAEEEHEEVVVKKFPLRALGKAHVMGATEGLVKMVADGKTGQLLGVHMAAVNASSLLGEAALALRLECTAEELAATIHAHPTLAEALRETAEGVIGLPVNWMG
jgi:dihydrolipoamide dehydrogenase